FPEIPAGTRSSPQHGAPKALLSPGIPAYRRSTRKRQDRPVTPEVAGSSPVAPAFDTPPSCSPPRELVGGLEVAEKGCARLGGDDDATVLPDSVEGGGEDALRSAGAGSVSQKSANFASSSSAS